MRCVEKRVIGLAMLCCLQACSLLPSGSEPASPAPTAAPSTASKTTRPGSDKAASSEVRLAPPSRSRNWEEVRRQAAHRLVAANPHITHTGRPQDILLAVPVITVELNADGSIKSLDVMRYPKQARDTVEIAKQAIRRAAPFGLSLIHI